MNNRAQIIIGAENQAGPGVKKAQADLRELGNAADKTGSRIKKSFHKATISSNSFSGSVSKLYASMAALAVLVGAGAIARGFLETAAAMEKTRLMLEGLTGSSEKAEASMDWLLKFATTAPYQLSTLSDTFVKLRVAGLDPTAGSMQALVDAVAAFGGSNEQLQRASVAIMQMAGKGVISMEELRQQLGEAVPDAIHVMAHEMGMTVRDLVDMISKGNLDATTGLTALFEGWAKKHAGAAETFANSMSGLWNQIKLQYELFKNDMMSSGDSFITIKAALKTTLDLIKRWREDGSIIEWSEYVVKALGVVVEGVRLVGKAFLGWKLIWEGLVIAWDATVAGIYASMAWLADKLGILLEKLADVQEFLNFDATADKTRIAAASMREWADETSRAADVLIDDIATEGVKGIEDTVTAIIDLDQKTAQLKAAFYDNVKAMKEQAEAGKAAGSAVAEGTEKATEAVDKLDPKLEASYDKLHDFLAIHSQADEAARKIAALNIEYDRMAEQLTDMQLAGLEVVEMSEQLEQWYANRMDEITKKTEETTSEVSTLWTSAMDRVQSLMADTFMDAMKGKLNSFKDIFKSFCDVLLRYWAEMLAQMVMQSRVLQGITAGLGGIFGGFFGGGGTAQAGGAGGAGGTGITQQAGFSLLGGLAQGFGNMGTSLLGVMPALTEQIGEIFYHAGWNSGYNFTYGVTEYLSGAGSIVGGALTAGIGTFLLSGLIGGDWAKAAVQGGGAGTGAAAGGYIGSAVPGIGTAVGLAVGAIVGGIAGMFGASFLGGNKKRSYLGQEYTYGTYSPESGWGAPEMYEYKEKRSGEDFRESAENMAQSGLDLANAMDTAFKELLGIFGEDWVTQFTTTVGQMAAKAPTFDFNISAEDKGEFKKDWRKSWQSMTENLIAPIVTIGSDLLEEALSGVVTDSSVWNYFTDDFKDYLTDALDSSLADLEIDWSQVTDQESLEAAFETMGMAAENIAAVVGHFEQVGAIMDGISDAIAMHDLDDSIVNAIGEFRRINSEFDQFADVLRANGVDLSKYTDLEIAHGFAIEDAAHAMTLAGASGEELTEALDHVAKSMLEAGKTAEQVAAMYDSAAKGAKKAAEEVPEVPEVQGGLMWGDPGFVLPPSFGRGGGSSGGGRGGGRLEVAQNNFDAIMADILGIISAVDASAINNYAEAFSALNKKYETYIKALVEMMSIYPELESWVDTFTQAYDIELGTLIDSFMDPLREIVDTEGMDDYAQSVYNLTKKYDDITEALKSMGKWLDETGELTEYATTVLAAFDVELAGLTKKTLPAFSDEIKSLRQTLQGYIQEGWGREEYVTEYNRLSAAYSSLDPQSANYQDESMDYLSQMTDTLSSLLQLQKQTVEELKNTAKSIASTISDLTLGSLAPVQSVEAITREYMRLYSNVLGASPENMAGAAQAFSDFASGPYLEFMKAYAPTNYQDIFSSTIADLKTIMELVQDTSSKMEVDWNALYDNLGSILDNSIDDLGTTLAVAINSIANALGISTDIIAPGSTGPSPPAPTPPSIWPSGNWSLGPGNWEVPVPASMEEWATMWEELAGNTLTDIVEKIYGDPPILGRTVGDHGWSANRSGGGLSFDYWGSGGLTHGLSYAGEAGPEWVIPTYEPQRSSFLRDVGADPEKIGKSVAKNLAPLLFSNDTNEKEIHVHLSIDGREIRNPVIAGLRGRDSELIEAIRKAVA